MRNCGVRLIFQYLSQHQFVQTNEKIFGSISLWKITVFLVTTGSIENIALFNLMIWLNIRRRKNLYLLINSDIWLLCTDFLIISIKVPKMCKYDKYYHILDVLALMVMGKDKKSGWASALQSNPQKPLTIHTVQCPIPVRANIILWYIREILRKNYMLWKDNIQVYIKHKTNIMN